MLDGCFIPSVLVGWRRLLAGEYRDPLVGRDLLVGCIAGGLGCFLLHLCFPLYIVFGYPEAEPLIGSRLYSDPNTLSLFSGATAVVSIILNKILISVVFSLVICVSLYILRVLFRKTWVAIAAFLALRVMLYSISDDPLVGLLINLIWVVIPLFIFFRFGILSLAAFCLFTSILDGFPITTRTSASYFDIGLTGLILLLALVLYAFRTSLGGRPMFGTPRLDD